jgi:hypothetical protein
VHSFDIKTLLQLALILFDGDPVELTLVHVKGHTHQLAAEILFV